MAFEFDWEVSPGLPAVPTVPRHLHLVPGTGSEVGSPNLDALMGIPNATAWVARLSRAVAEVSIGQRPAQQLTRYVARDELARISARGQAVRRHPSARSQGEITPIRAVRSVRVCPVSDKAVETSAVLVGGSRAQAIAMRMERIKDAWVVTDIALP